MKILIIGGNGQLGKTLNSIMPSRMGMDLVEVLSITRKDLDLCDIQSCKKIVKQIQPDYLINVAAYTNVDLAERNSEMAFSVNAFAPKAFAEILRINGGKLIHFSTDYVFDGKSNMPYKPFDLKNPINIYGQTKAEGEDYILDILQKSNQCFIIRTSWVISQYGNNFLLKVLDLLNQKENINIVSDQMSSPTSTKSLSNFCLELIKTIHLGKECSSILHWTDSGLASWYDLAQAISEYGKELGILINPAKINPIKTIDYPVIASRPLYSVLDITSTINSINLKQIYWRESVKEILHKIAKLQ